MLKLTKTDIFINTLSEQKFVCPSCLNEHMMKRGNANYSKRNYGGPFCGKCGNKLLSDFAYKKSLN